MMRKYILRYLFVVITLSACKKEPQSVYPAGSNDAVNQWVLNQMRDYYLWSADLPQSPDLSQTPLDFFSGLKSQVDRFSVFVNKDVSASLNRTLSNTFGFELIHINENNTDLTLIGLVVPGTAADLAGLKRGDTITHLNETLISASNIATLVQTSLKQTSITLLPIHGSAMIIPAAYISENPVYTSLIYSQNGLNTAYLFLNAFDFKGAYDVLDAFKTFKNIGVRDLILDLRYNPGGNVSFSAFMATLIATVSEDDTYVRYKGNANVGERNSTFADEFSQQPDGYHFLFGDVKAASLNLPRVFVLTGSYTASSAELLIQALKPYITVVQIGQQTYGKDVAAVEMTDESGQAGDWILRPVVYKLYNKNGSGDYTNGLTPNHVMSEYSSLPLFAFGDMHDPLIHAALSAIDGHTKESKTSSRAAILTPHYESNHIKMQSPLLINH